MDMVLPCKTVCFFFCVVILPHFSHEQLMYKRSNDVESHDFFSVENFDLPAKTNVSSDNNFGL